MSVRPSVEKLNYEVRGMYRGQTLQVKGPTGEGDYMGEECTGDRHFK